MYTLPEKGFFVLFEHPKIKEACAVGITDSYRGETVKAFVSIKQGEALSEADSIRFCKEKLNTKWLWMKSIEF